MNNFTQIVRSHIVSRRNECQQEHRAPKGMDSQGSEGDGLWDPILAGEGNKTFLIKGGWKPLPSVLKTLRRNPKRKVQRRNPKRKVQKRTIFANGGFIVLHKLTFSFPFWTWKIPGLGGFVVLHKLSLFLSFFGHGKFRVWEELHKKEKAKWKALDTILSCFPFWFDSIENNNVQVHFRSHPPNPNTTTEKT